MKEEEAQILDDLNAAAEEFGYEFWEIETIIRLCYAPCMKSNGYTPEMAMRKITSFIEQGHGYYDCLGEALCFAGIDVTDS